jgi:RND family efflux transporter MFP subunit
MNDTSNLLNQLRIDRREDPPPTRGRALLLAAVIGLPLLVFAGWWAWSARGAPAKVQVAAAHAIAGHGGSASVLDATGYVVARRMATVSAKITGKVREVLIEEGQHVDEGQVLATLDPVDANAQRDLSGAQFGAAQSQVDSVRAQLTEAEANARRMGDLVQRQLVARSVFDQAVAQRDSLRAQLVTAQRNAKVAADQLRIAANGVDNTIVRAPFEGVVIAKAAQPGEIVSPVAAGGGSTRTGIATLVDMDSLEVEVDVGEAFIGRVAPKMPVEATLNAYPDWKIPAEVIAIIPTADRGKATVKVRVALLKKDPRIVPDMGVRVSFLEKAAPAAASAPNPGVLVPAAAIANRKGATVAFVVVGDRVAQRAVTVGRSLGDEREVTAGLADGDAVVLNPGTDLADGARVSVAAPSSETSP